MEEEQIRTQIPNIPGLQLKSWHNCLTQEQACTTVSIDTAVEWRSLPSRANSHEARKIHQRMVRRLLPFSKECRRIVSVYYSRIVYVVLIWGWMLERTFAGDWRVKLKQSFPQARINYPTQLSFLLDWENKTKEKLRFLEVDFFL